jgi:hypothetical protein
MIYDDLDDRWAGSRNLRIGGLRSWLCGFGDEHAGTGLSELSIYNHISGSISGLLFCPFPTLFPGLLQ